MSLNALHDLFIDELEDLYNAETQLLKAIPKMSKAVTSPELRKAMKIIWNRRSHTTPA